MYAKPMSLQSRLYQYLDSQYPETRQETEMFGVEVELEGKNGISKMTPEIMQFWTAHNDGSLRKMNPGDEAIEYVTNKPYNRGDILQAVKIMMDFLNAPPREVYESYRTSIHVHVNCLADTQLHVFNFVTLCLLFDELFVSQNGDHRVGNNFCLRAKDAQGQVVDLIHSIEMHGNLFGIGNNNRYSSINFASLTKFGTVEFRSLECTTDIFRVIHWIMTINALKQASRVFNNPQDIIEKFSMWSGEDFIKNVLGPQAAKYLKVPNYNDMLFNGMRIAQEFAFCSKWINRPDVQEPVAKPKAAKNAAHQPLQGVWIDPPIAVAAVPHGHLQGQWGQAQPAPPEPEGAMFDLDDDDFEDNEPVDDEDDF